MVSTTQDGRSQRPVAIAVGGLAFALLALLLLIATAAAAQDTTATLQVTIPGPDAGAGDLVEVLLDSQVGAIADVESVDGALSVVLDGDRTGPSTFSVRDPELLAAFAGESVPISVLTRIVSQSPGTGGGSIAGIGTPFNVDIGATYGYAALVVDATVDGADEATVAAGAPYVLTIGVSNAGTVDLSAVVVSDNGVTVCAIERLGAGGTDRCTVEAVADGSVERTVTAGASVVDDPNTMVSASDSITIAASEPAGDEVLGTVVTQTDDDADDEDSEDADDGDAEPADTDDGDAEPAETDTDSDDDDGDELAMTGRGTALFAALGLGVVALGLGIRSEGRAARRRVELR